MNWSGVVAMVGCLGVLGPRITMDNMMVSRTIIKFCSKIITLNSTANSTREIKIDFYRPFSRHLASYEPKNLDPLAMTQQSIRRPPGKGAVQFFYKAT